MVTFFYRKIGGAGSSEEAFDSICQQCRNAAAGHSILGAGSSLGRCTAQAADQSEDGHQIVGRINTISSDYIRCLPVYGCRNLHSEWKLRSRCGPRHRSRMEQLRVPPVDNLIRLFPCALAFGNLVVHFLWEVLVQLCFAVSGCVPLVADLLMSGIPCLRRCQQIRAERS